MMKRGIFIMQENVLENNAEREKQAFVKMLQLEDLAEKKAKIYARLLTDNAFAKRIGKIHFFLRFLSYEGGAYFIGVKGYFRKI